ncbi:hypothetical protein [Flavobacterium caseinilyticum]|uniref:Uncharacterized protein n=1 Tax=Flavobacterium caseinilyticum TaxID=2541732 RepID=A0A4R5AZB3_9FLAO|nr:hypothetical protein [Flavobacterium caseinilyticum]TDD77500.1 hypothetical protein E0F89_07925 [Flavobacterium caseinilyticum]
MKLIQSFLIFAFVLLSTNTISAQYGNGGYGNGYGSNRRMNSGMDQSRAQDKPKEIPVEVTVRKIIERVKPELNLDALQEIAISNILVESIKTQGILVKAEVSQEDKIKNIQALSEVTDRKIMELLNKDQKEKYTAMNEEAKNPKKSNSKKKAKQ